MSKKPTPFCEQLLAWHQKHGRHDLPWCEKRTAYRVWISEIMLQQTQVSTVIGYFHRFMKAFPSVKALALARENEVFNLWSGLGYYRRARFCHETAKIIHHQHHGRFPRTLEALMALPGIGKSTACAILSLAFEQPFAIMDGNVKRVLTRFHGIRNEVNTPETLKQLWQIASMHMPDTQCSDYTQAIMDLGATICKKQPLCEQCPQQSDCQAFEQQITDQIPLKTRRVKVQKRHMHLLHLQHGNESFLIQRGEGDIWARMWCLPELPDGESLSAWCKQFCDTNAYEIESEQTIEHQLTHRRLYIKISRIQLPSKPKKLSTLQGVWYKKGRFIGGLPKPINHLIKEKAAIE